MADPKVKILVAELDQVVAIQIYNNASEKPETQYFDKDSFDSVRFERVEGGIWRIRNFK
jgi:hypothetical protein